MKHFFSCRIFLRLLVACSLSGCGLVRALALEPSADPSLAVVRIKSHGASGTIIATTEGKSWILSCAHMFFGPHDTLDDKYTRKKIVIDGPAQPYAPQKLAATRLLGADADHDLSLIEIDNGPFNYVPVAPQGFQPGQNLNSAGYDEMKWPITSKHATILVTLSDWTYTREKPWHGRSGGGLFDLDAKVLIGVVNGYELQGQARGIYVSHASILRFLARYQGHMTHTPLSPPTPMYRQPWQAPPNPWCPGGS